MYIGSLSDLESERKQVLTDYNDGLMSASECCAILDEIDSSIETFGLQS